MNTDKEANRFMFTLLAVIILVIVIYAVNNNMQGRIKELEEKLADQETTKQVEIIPTANCNAKELLQIANSLASSKKYEDAADAYLKTIQCNPNISDAYYNLGVTYYYLARYNEAAHEFTKALELNPRSLNDENQQVLEVLKIVVKAHLSDRPGPSQGKTPLSWCERMFISLPPSEDDIPALKARLEQDPTDYQALLLLAIYDEQNGDYVAALEKRQKIVELDPASDNYYALGEIYQILGYDDNAIAEYVNAVEDDPLHYLPHSALGNLYFDRGLMNKAVAHYAWAYATCPDSKKLEALDKALDALP
jgi:tetratricopeptide (TPR) repeat protein